MFRHMVHLKLIFEGSKVSLLKYTDAGTWVTPWVECPLLISA